MNITCEHHQPNTQTLQNQNMVCDKEVPCIPLFCYNGKTGNWALGSIFNGNTNGSIINLKTNMHFKLASSFNLHVVTSEPLVPEFSPFYIFLLDIFVALFVS